MGVKLCRALKEEKIAARSAILPMLQAEEDERYYPILSAIIVGVIFSLALHITLKVHGAHVDLSKSGRSILRRRRGSWKMFQGGRSVRTCTTLENGCLRLLVSSALRFGKGLLQALGVPSCHEGMNKAFRPGHPSFFTKDQLFKHLYLLFSYEIWLVNNWTYEADVWSHLCSYFDVTCPCLILRPGLWCFFL